MRILTLNLTLAIIGRRKASFISIISPSQNLSYSPTDSILLLKPILHINNRQNKKKYGHAAQYKKDFWLQN